ncbi:MFS transporter [Cohnella mopanensis]|uniref:MFS transporter n=1 Tax=Cohnella mopanensis TaxID=2911966 RepID=UPI001EF98123
MENVVQTNLITSTANNKVKLPEKFAFFAANIGDIPIMTIIGGYLLIYYTNVVGLNPAAVGILFLVARILDAVADPIVGYLIDHLPRVRMGRFRPWLILGSLLCSINFLALWLGPDLANSGKLLIAYITYLLIGPTFACMDISLNSLIPAMTSSTKERNTLSIIKGVAYIIGATVCSMIVVPFVASFSTERMGYHWLIIAVSVFVFVMCTIGSLGVKERVLPTRTDNYPIKLLFKIVFQSKPLIVLFVGSLFVMVGNAVRQGSQIYYLTYNADNPGLMVTASLVGLVMMLISIGFMPFLIKRFDKKHVLIASFILAAIGAIALFPVPYHSGALIVTTIGVNSLGLGALMSINYSLQADTIDYVEWKHGYRAEGIVSSLNSFVAKVGQALGGAIPAFMLSMTGFNAEANAQNGSTLLGINLSMSVIPFVTILLGALIYCAYPLTRDRIVRITSELDLRNKDK